VLLLRAFKIDKSRLAPLAVRAKPVDAACFLFCESPVSMRVQRTVPQFTFGFSARFVNAISSVSTGFFWFLPVLSHF
jgi:hypothetical protein